MTDLTTLDELETCLAASEAAPLFILKHSTACPISAMAHDRAARFFEAGGRPPLYRVKVIEDRPVSNAIAEQLGVPHKSPQLILVRARKALWSTSHHNIQADTITEALAAHAG